MTPKQLAGWKRMQKIGVVGFCFISGLSSAGGFLLLGPIWNLINSRVGLPPFVLRSELARQTFVWFILGILGGSIMYLAVWRKSRKENPQLS